MTPTWSGGVRTRKDRAPDRKPDAEQGDHVPLAEWPEPGQPPHTLITADARAIYYTGSWLFVGRECAATRVVLSWV